MPENTPNKRIQERIEALLRLAEDPNATPDERNLALARVATLTEKYKIDAARLDPHSGQYTREDIEVHTFFVPSTGGIKNARYHGVYQVVEAMGASCYLVKDALPRKNKGFRYVLSGLTVHATASTMSVLKVLIPSLVLQEASASTAFIDRLKETDSYINHLQTSIATLHQRKINPMSFRTALNTEIRRQRKSHSLAFFVEAAELIRKRRSDAVQEAGRGYDLVILDTAERIQRSLEDLDLSTRKARKDAKYSQAGWDSGTEAGRQAVVGQTELHGGRLEIEQ